MFLRIESIFHITADEVKIIGEKSYGLELTSRNGFGVAKKETVGCYIFHGLGDPDFCNRCSLSRCLVREQDDKEFRAEARRAGY